jgi:hypothetical protein
MAKILGGNPLGTMSGKMGGIVFSRNRFGQYIRNRVKPVNPRTHAQTLSRGRFSTASASWLGLTDGVRTAWNSFASVTKVRTRRGDMAYITGQEFFVKAAKLQVTFGFVAPTTVPLQWFDLSGEIASVDAVSAKTGPPPVTEQFKIHLLTVPPVTQYAIVQATTQMGAGVNFASQGLFRTVATITTPLTHDLDIDVGYQAKFGPLIINRCVFVRVMLLDISAAGGGHIADGQSPWLTWRAIVT